MLDVAAVILAGYMIRLRDTMEQHHADAEQLARCDAACWEALKDRARLMVEFLEPVGRGPIH
jgi:hypothetical protein